MLSLAGAAVAEPWVVAHRGGPRMGPENELATFKKAIALDVDALEMDIHPSKDGVLMVIHDDTLDRTFGRSGRVEEMTEAELLAVGLPSLQQVIDASQGRWRLLVEIKHPRSHRYEGVEQLLVDQLRRNGILEQTVVISFDRTTLEILHALEPSLATGFLTSKKTDPARARDELGVRYYCPDFRLVDAEVARATHQAGLKLSVWTVNRPEDMQSMLQAGCDAITSDDPQLLLKIARP
jgi:glycerophosphoryl diester phosphodiesterase